MPPAQPSDHNAPSSRSSAQRDYRAVMRAIPDLMIVMRRDGTYVEFDWNADTPPSRSTQDIIGSNLRDIGFSEKTVRDTFAAMERAFATGEVQIFLYESLQDDTAVPYEARVAALDDEEALIIVRDITSSRRAEEQLAERVEQLTILHEVDEELSQVLSVDYVVTMALDAAMRLSGATSGTIGLAQEDGSMRLAKVAGDHNADIADENMRNRTGAVGRVLRTMRPELIPDVTADPDYIVNRPKTKAQITIPIVAQEQFIGVLNLETDHYGIFTTERFNFLKLIVGRVGAALDNARLHRKLQSQLEQLKTLYEQVSQLEQLKTDMIRIASHDLRNPLSSILGLLEMLGWDIDDLPDGGKLSDQVHQIEKAAKRMQKIVEDILSLERIEQMAQQMTHVRFDLRDMARQTYLDYSKQAEHAQQTMTLNLPDEPVYVEGDPVQLGEAMANLVTNAIKYSRANGTIQIRLDSDGWRAIFEVVDDGIGIRKEQQERLFQPFYRARSSETVGIEGTGLGLHLVKNIVERHGGKMRFESEYGAGSTFGFHLKRAYMDGTD